MNKQLLILLFLSTLLIQCQPSQANKNEDNLNKITKGMHVVEVERIMGTPDGIENVPLNETEFILRYKSPTGFSGDFQIFVSRQDSTILRVYRGD